jgi:trimeric autotransporter adhesin
MKRNMIKILGVVLTLAILAGLLMTAVPVSAATNAFSVAGQPSVVTTTVANVYAIAPDGNTIYVYDGAKLNKSTDGGKTWTDSGVDTGTTKLAGNAINEIVISKSSASNMAATDGTDLFRSTNAGNTWGTNTPPTAGTINDIDISESSGGSVTYLAGCTDGVWLYDTDAGNGWVNLDPADFAGNAAGVAFSPSYSTDTAIVAFNSSTLALQQIVIYTDATTAAWNDDVADADLSGVAAGPTGTAYASLALPSNYDPASSSANKVLVGLGDSAGTMTGVYRVNGKATTSTVKVLDDGVNVFSLAYKGSASAGTLLVGQVDVPDVLSNTSAMTTSGTSFEWTNSGDYKSPTGETNTLVAFSPASTTAYAGTMGAGSALAMSVDYQSWAEFAFISVSSLANASLDKLTMPKGGSPMFVVVKDAGAPNQNMIFASTDNGTSWTEILNNGIVGIDGVKVTGTYSTDKTIYVTQKGVDNDNKIIKSIDGGATWSTIHTPGNVHLTTISVVDANNYWVGSAGQIQLSSSSTKALIEGTPKVMVVIPGFFVAMTGEGTLYVSTDSGATFTKLGNTGQFLVAGPPGVLVPPNVALDPPTKTIYAQETTSKNVLKWTVGTDTAWTTEIEQASLPGMLQGHMFGALDLQKGVWYIMDASAVAGHYQIWRSVDDKDPVDAGFDPITGSAPDGAIGGKIAAGPPNIIFDAAGVPTYYSLVTRTTIPAKEYATTVTAYTDSLISAPTTVAPAANASIPVTGTNFSWNPVSGNNIKYQAQIAVDTAFKSVWYDSSAVNPNHISATILPTPAGLQAGQQYYFRVRVVEPMISKWSTAVPFTTLLESNAGSGLDVSGRISPENGATGVATNAALTWGTVNGATSYNIKIATDSAFTNVIDSKDGLTVNVYAPAKAFDPGKTYFWEVQAVNATTKGNWIASAFTTSSGAPAGTVQPTQTIVVPTPTFTVIPGTTGPAPAPTTPAYIWVIIAIGAVLVIAVIVLIARTRRV